jgi:peroxiredoxin
MKTIRVFTMLFVFCTIFSLAVTPQESNTSNPLKDILKGLSKAGMGDLDLSKPINLYSESIPKYTEDGKQVKSMDLSGFLTSGEYMTDMYIDNNKEIKVVVLRKASEEEKSLMKKMMESQKKKSELIGTKANGFSVTDINGNKYDLDQLKEKVVVLNFWFAGCKPCIMEMPELNKLVDEFKGKDVDFLGLSTDSAERIVSFLKTKEFKYNLVPECKKIAESYYVQGFPTHVVIDKDSIIKLYESGLNSNTVENVETEINKQLNQK